MPRIETRVGKAGWDDHRFRGHAVYAELLGRTPLSRLLALAIGVELDSEETRVLDELAVAATLPDPHIWPLKLPRVANAYGGSPISGLVAGLLATDGPILGAGSVRPGAQWLHGLVVAQTSSADAQAEVRRILMAGGRLPGFGVPARKVDERVTAMARCVEAHGRAGLPHWSLWIEIVEETRRHGVEPNVGSSFCAALLDLGFPPHTVHVVVHLCTLPVFLGNAVEGAEQHPQFFREIPSEHLAYEGPARRRSPRATEG